MGVGMGPSNWMVPRLTLSAEAQLQSTLQTLDAHGAENPEETVKLAKALAQQNVIQQAIIRQAVGYVAELELVLVCLKAPPRPRRRWWQVWKRR